MQPPPKNIQNATTSCPPPRSQSDTIIWAYSLRDFIPSFKERQATILNSGDVTFSTPHEVAITTYTAIFSVAAAARGRAAIPPERYGKRNGAGIGEILKDGEGEDLPPSSSFSPSNENTEEGGEGGKKVVKCYDEGFKHVKRIYNHIVTKTGEQMDRLLDEVLKTGGEGYVSGCASADFKIELEAEEGGDGEEGEEEERVISVPARAPKRESVGRKRGSVVGSVQGSSRRTSTALTTPTRKKPGDDRAATGKGKAVVPAKVTTGAESTSKKPPVPRAPAPAPSSTSTSTDQTSSSYAEIHLHRFIVITSIPYYKYLDLTSRLRFSDTSSNSSTLPFPTVTYYALRVIQRWLYNPLRIGEVIEEFEPGAHLYLLSNCKRQDRNGYPPPLATAKGIIEVARAADYLGITELTDWSDKILRKMCHGLHKCGGTSCRTMVPFIFDEVYKSGGMGLSEQLSKDIKNFLAMNVESMWKRPVIMLDDGCLEELVETFKGLHVGCGVPSPGSGVNNPNVAGKKKSRNVLFEDGVVTKPLHWWHLYLELNSVRVSVLTSASGNANRWMEKLLGPTMEHCVHEITRGFNDPRLAADLQSKMEDGSFQKDLVVEMLMMVTMSSVFAGEAAGELSIPFEKPPLTRRTVKAVFEGIVNLRTWDGRDGEWGKAEKRVLDFLGREWMTIVVSGEGKDGKSGFANWRPAMLGALSTKLRVSKEDLLGTGARKGLTLEALPGRGGLRTVKDSLGNDIIVDRRNLRRTEVDEFQEGEGSGSSSSRALRPEATAFVPSGGVTDVDGAADGGA
ncbi:hypothetical protein TWF281_010001 [Arthrobotrys megalospora]